MADEPGPGRLKRALSSFSGLPEGKAPRVPTKYEIFWNEKVKKRWKNACKWLCDSRVFATTTMALTFYALFGDDMRLIFTSKTEDPWFDRVTITAMVMFSIEIIAFIGGKAGYLFGFFFWLDILSTVTLIIDITDVGESLFGDSISAASKDESGDSGGAGDSAEAARAARMSRAGTKAGRVVRLIRLLRLIKMLKVFKKDKGPLLQSYPGEDWDDDEDANIQESAVSKKLSEMTTRRVIILVLTIMLSLPVFRPEMYKDNLDSAGQYGLNILYRRWRDSVYLYGKHDEWEAGLAQQYMESYDRQVYEDLFLLYIYKHNYFVEGSNVPDGKSSPTDSFNRIFWMGVRPAESPLGQYVFPRLSTYDWNEKWNGKDWDFYSGNMPPSIPAMFRGDYFQTSNLCVHELYRGYSLIANESDHIVCPEELRYQERTVIFPQYLSQEEMVETTFMFVFDRRGGSRFEAQLNTYQTLFVCLLLSVGSMTFASDANKLVLAPIERMISKLDRIRNNPLEALKIGDEEHHKEQMKAARNNATDEDDGYAPGGRIKRFLRIICPCCRKRLGALEREAPEPMETQVLERTIIKIGSLLALGFGEAGAQIIAQNMKESDSSGIIGVAPGRRIEAVFAFCDIRTFTDATEVLQDQVMIFVNRIAAIVHALCDEFWGNPNKNVGDAFLLVWRLSGQSQTSKTKLTDMSLMSLASMVAKLSTSSDIAEYRTHYKLLKRIPDFRVRVGFGLHMGWAIEGAIGSEFKIDASYLSPNVNVSALLAGSTKYYGVHILCSEAINMNLSEQIAEECRLIDFADLSGGIPTKLFTLDLDDENLEVDAVSAAPATKASKFKSRWERQRRKNERWADDSSMQKLMQSNQAYLTMRSRFTEEFFCKYQMAYLNYEAGNWPIAVTMLEETRYLLGIEDGASSALLRLIQKYHGNAPKNWMGFRPFGVWAKEPLECDKTSEMADRLDRSAEGTITPLSPSASLPSTCNVFTSMASFNQVSPVKPGETSDGYFSQGDPRNDMRKSLSASAFLATMSGGFSRLSGHYSTRMESASCHY